jgi:hypothetical protein
MGKKDLYQIAQEAEKQAHIKDRQSTLSRGGPTQGEVSKAYEKAADSWLRAGDYKRAYGNYKRASTHAVVKREKDKIQRKISGLPSSSKKGLEKRTVYASFAIISLAVALFFISLNLTGSAVGISGGNYNFISVGLFIFGLFFAFLYFKKKEEAMKKNSQ